MKIALVVEGKTEKAFLPHLRTYLQPRLAGRMPDLDCVPQQGLIPSRERLKRLVNSLLYGRSNPADHVIALTDVYTGSTPPAFSDAADAKSKMREWVGREPRFHPHAAQFEFEAWLLPYWPRIQQLARHNKIQPQGGPETINHANSPARRIREVFRLGHGRHYYVKQRDAGRILQGPDLSLAVDRCPELKALVNSFLGICGGDKVP